MQLFCCRENTSGKAEPVYLELAMFLSMYTDVFLEITRKRLLLFLNVYHCHALVSEMTYNVSSGPLNHGITI